MADRSGAKNSANSVSNPAAASLGATSSAPDPDRCRRFLITVTTIWVLVCAKSASSAAQPATHNSPWLYVACFVILYIDGGEQ